MTTIAEAHEPKTLNAVFSLAQSPPGFNVIYFLAVAESVREAGNFDDIAFHVIPGPSEGFRELDTEYDPENKRWRVRQIVQQAAWLLPSVKAVHIHNKPIVVEGECFPGPIGMPKISGYGQVYEVARRGADLRKFSASGQARVYVKQWLSRVAGSRRPVVVSLRESSYDTWRNSNIQAWSEFAQMLNPMVYCPIVVRDTEQALNLGSHKLAQFDAPWASHNLDLRAALYEQAWLNVAINHGAQELFNFLKDCRSLQIWLRNCGPMPDGRPLEGPGRRSIVSTDSNARTIKKYFEHMVDEIEAMGRESAA